MLSIAIFCHNEPGHKQKPLVGDLTPLILAIHRYSQLVTDAACDDRYVSRILLRAT
jgi:hypothetical protein